MAVGVRSGSDNRWQGYTHQELYDMLHAGPGSGAAGEVADQWSGMSSALADIQQEISAGVAASGATWDGAAADAARGAIGPLGDWAQQASTAADVMRISTELQSDLLAKARADMPAPVAVPRQPSQIGQLVTGQIDYEVIELSSDAAAQQAYQVMAQYEAATIDNVSTLGDFGDPPTLVVDTTPITGPVVRTGVRSPDAVRSVPRSGSGSTRSGSVESTRSGSTRSGSTRSGSTRSGSTRSESTRSESSRAAGSSDESTPREPSPSESSPSESSQSESTPRAVDSPQPGGTTPDSATGPTNDMDAPAKPEVLVDEAATTPTSVVGAAAEAAVTPVIGSTTPSSAGPNRRSTNDSTSSPPGGSFAPATGSRAFTGAVVPAARRSDDADEPDDVHQSTYLIEADDIYGSQTYTPPVIGESPRHR